MVYEEWSARMRTHTLKPYVQYTKSCVYILEEICFCKLIIFVCCWTSSVKKTVALFFASKDKSYDNHLGESQLLWMSYWWTLQLMAQENFKQYFFTKQKIQ